MKEELKMTDIHDIKENLLKFDYTFESIFFIGVFIFLLLFYILLIYFLSGNKKERKVILEIKKEDKKNELKIKLDKLLKENKRLNKSEFYFKINMYFKEFLFLDIGIDLRNKTLKESLIKIKNNNYCLFLEEIYFSEFSSNTVNDLEKRQKQLDVFINFIK